MIEQRLDLPGGWLRGVWTCPGCGAQLASAVIDHQDGCAEVARMAAAAGWTPPEGEQP